MSIANKWQGRQYRGYPLGWPLLVGISFVNPSPDNTLTLWGFLEVNDEDIDAEEGNTFAWNDEVCISVIVQQEELATTDAALLTHNHAEELSSCSSKNIK